ncbi:TetR/AcrR family transcriptional regulator [Mucilaginibacter sp. HC2]|uniref:TetR/AcrR family transcriptional regulator n=1 Tax=Mucilaginibacter inviolabilis TaxID=2714892 RepID=UPI00140DB40C|nr:TetR/AcrR family transcriptional regulator [Mucilaginibacter inviolabilis]NHA03765.1 TetR/AcrR family transcriptional regulator [Mucilaginibacter inviolabilis]
MTKEDIIQNSLKQFLLNGIRKMTVQQIVAPLGISTKTVYKYFSGKEELLEACLLVHYEKMGQEFKKMIANSSNPAERLFKMFFMGLEEDFKVAPVFYHDLNYYYPEMQDKVISRYYENNGQHITDTIKNGMEQGFFRPELNARVVLESLGLLYRSLTRTGQYREFNLSPFELASNTIVVFLRGICTPKGIKILDNLKYLSP